MAVDGFLKIKTKLDNSDIDSDVKELENKIAKLELDNRSLDSQQEGLQQELNDYNKLIAKAEEYANEINQLNAKRKEMLQQNPTLATSSNNSEYANINAQLTEIQQKYDAVSASIDKQYTKIGKIPTELEKIKLKQEENNLKISEYQSKIDDVDFDNIENSLSKTNTKTDSIIKKVGKWALAVFGVRSAYSAIRTAMSTLTQYNQQLSTDISYIQYALAKILEPVILRLVNLVYKVLSYVNYLAKAWFNVDLFANSSASSFVSASNSLSSAAQSAKELEKATSGFDEMNIIQDTSSSSSDTSSSVYTPSVDLSGIEDVEIPEWLVKIKEFFQPIIDFFKEIIDKYGPVAGGIAIVVGALAGFIIIKSIIKWITSLGTATSGLTVDFTGFFNALGKAAEAIAILGGIALVIEAVTDLIDSFSASGMTLGEVAGLLGIVLGEVAATFLVLAAAMKFLEPSWQSIAGAAVIFAGLAVVLVTVTNLIDTFSKSGMSLGDVIGLLATILVTIVALMGSVALLGPAMTAGLVPFVAVIAGISALLIVMAATLPTILDACSSFINSIAPVVIALITTINECINNTIRVLGEVLPPIINSVGSVFTSIFKGIQSVVTSVGNAVSKIVNSIGDSISGVLEGIRKIIQQVGDTITQVATTVIWFINQLGPAINNFVDNAITAVTKLVNFVISAIEYLINTLLIPAYNKIAETLSKLPLISISSASKISIARFSPKLATGGIVDLPGRGVDIGGAIAGEAGREGVLPLTNQATMAELGQEIGKWIKVSNTVNTYMNGRLVQRQMSKQQQELAYATNGRM